MEEAKVARINELYKKSQEAGLSEEEREEQQALRREYIEAYKRNLRQQLDGIKFSDHEQDCGCPDCQKH